MQNQSAAVIAELQNRIGSANFSQWQIHRWQFWDYVRYPTAGTTELLLFNNATGATDPVSTLQKTIEETNVPQTGQFGQVYFFINQIRCHAKILPLARQTSDISTDADVLWTTLGDMMPKYMELLRRGVLKIKIGQKDYFQIERPFEVAPPGMGLNVIQYGSSRITQVLYGQQNQEPSNVYGVAPMQMIEPNQTLEVKFVWDTTSPAFTGLVNSADPRINVGVIFDGYIARPTQ